MTAIDRIFGKYPYGSGSVTYNLYIYNLGTNTYNETSVTNGGGVNNTNFSNGSGSNQWIYTDRLLNSSTAWSIAKGAQKPTGQDLFAENYISSIKWELIPNSNNTITIPNTTGNYYTINKGTFNTTLATLQDSVYTEQIMMLIRAYNGTNWEVITDRQLFNDSENIINNVFPSVTENDILKSTIKLKSTTIPTNVIIVLRAYPDSYFEEQLNLQELEQFYYITDSKSVITSGALDVVATFSGDTSDYANDVNQAINNEQTDTNDSNLQDITNQLEQQQNWWQTTYENMFKIQSGDIERYIATIQEAIPLESGEIEEIETIFNYIQQEPDDFKITWGNFTPSWTVGNNAVEINQPLIKSGDVNFSKLEREHQEIKEIMKWVRIITNLSIYSILIHQMYLLIIATFGVGLELYGQNQEEKARLNAQIEKDKAIIRRQLFNANQEKLREYEKLARKKGWKK